MESEGEEQIKGAWNAEEDAQLINLVESHGAKNWTLISAGVPGRSGKSCRLRWCNQLSPAVQHRPFTAAEDAVIVAAHQQYGNRWATIARLMQGRTDNAVKNHWNSTLRRRLQQQQAAADVDSLDEGSDQCESRAAPRKRACRRTGEEEERMTLLSLRMPGAGEEEEGEGRNGSSVIVNGKEKGLLGVMREMIAEEVRSYMTKLGHGSCETLKVESTSDS